MANTKVMRYDRGNFRLDAAHFDEHTGFLKVPAAFTRTGVFEYELQDGSTRRELRPVEEVFDSESLRSLRMVPVTNEHPGEPLNTENARKFAVGATGDFPFPEDGLVVGMIAIHDADAIKEIREGKKELSGGYITQIDETPGVFEGIKFDAIQRFIRYNHVALVAEGRAGPEARLRIDNRFDAKTFGKRITTKEETMFDYHEDAKKFSFNGAKFDLSDKDGVKALKDAMSAFLKEAKDAMKAGKKDSADSVEDSPVFVALQAKFDAMTETLEAAKKKEAEVKTDSEFATAVAARVTLESFASRFVPKLDGLTDIEVKRAVIVAMTPEALREDKAATLAEKSDLYVEAMYDVKTDEVAKEDEAKGKRNGARSPQAPPRNTDNKEDASDVDAVTAARENYIAGLNGKTQKKEEK